MTNDALRCPRCRGTMRRSAATDGTLADCPRCGGIFIDNRAGALLLQGESSPEANAFLDAHDEGDFGDADAANAYRAMDAREAAICARCDRPMRAQTVAGIEIDICDEDGTFFDRQELKAFMFARAEDEAERRAEAGRRAAVAERQAETFHFDVRLPPEWWKTRGALGYLLSKVIHEVGLFIRR